MEQIRRRIYFCRGSKQLALLPTKHARRAATARWSDRLESSSGSPLLSKSRLPDPTARLCMLDCRCSVRTLSSSASARHQDFAVRKQCSVVQFASSGHHRSSVGPSGIRTVQVDDLCSRSWIGGATGRVKSAWASSHHQYLAVIVHHC